MTGNEGASGDTAFDFADERCPARRALDLIGDKWTPRVVLELSSGPVRYNALRRSLPGVSQRMLTRSLRRLEAEQLATRRVFDTIPPTVEYALTQKGVSLIQPLLGIANWGVATLGAQSSAARSPGQ